MLDFKNQFRNVERRLELARQQKAKEGSEF